MNALTTTVTGTSVSVLLNSVTINDVANGRSTATFYVNDDVAYTLKQQSPVTLSTTNEGVLFTGFVDSVETQRMSLLNANRRHLVTCKDGVWLASKRLFIGNEYVGRSAGDVVCDLHLNYLAAEGVIANYAARYDHDATTFGQGTQSGTAVNGNTLELIKAGTVYNKTETSQADFSTGTLSNVQANSNGTLTLKSTNAIKLSGIAASNISSNIFHYRMFWTGSMAIATGDYLKYDIWVSSSNPVLCGGIDLVCSDGTTFRDHLGSTGTPDFLDQNQLWGHPKQDLSGYANDQWYKRTLTVPAGLVGKTLSYATVVLEGDTGGSYAFYVRNVTIQTSGNTTKQVMYTGGAAMLNNQVISTIGYYNTACAVIKTYEASGSRTTANNSVAAVGCTRNSIISWNFLTQTQLGTASNYLPQIDIQTSTDDATTFQSCTNHGSIPNFPLGQTRGKNLTVMQMLAVGGPNPELSPILYDSTVTINPSYTPAAKTDVYAAYKTSGDFGTGTLTNVSYDSQLQATGQKISGNYKNWDDNDISGMTLFSSNTASPATMATTTSTFSMRSQGGADTKAQLNFAGQWADFTAEVDINIANTGNLFSYGMLFHTTNWSTARDTYALSAWINTTQIGFSKGSNAATGSYTVISAVNITLVAGQWYHMKVVAAANIYKIYLDNVLYITATDPSPTFTFGYFGLRMQNSDGTTANRYSCFFDNFGVMTTAFQGTRVTPSTSISACGIVNDSAIVWNSIIPGNTSILVEASTNGGSTWTTCTNGAPIPGASAGVNVAGLSLTIRTTYTTQNANAFPTVIGMSWTVVGAYSAAGNRVSPVLDISPPVTCGSSSITWTSIEPTGTAIGVDISLVGATGPWTAVTNGAAIPTIVQAPLATIDGFDANSSANYTSAFATGGAATTPTFDTANSQLKLAGGTNAVYINNLATGKDVVLDAISSQSNNGGFVFRYVDANNFYYIRVYDSLGVTPNTISLNKVVAGVVTTNIVTTSILFTRGTWHQVHLSNINTNITVLFDGVQKINTTDASLTTGKCGFYNGTGTALWNTIQIAMQGDPLAGKSIWSRTRLTSTNPAITPDLVTLSVSVRSTSIDTGVVVPLTAYQYKQNISGCIDDLAKQSNTWWNVDRNKKLQFQNKPDVRAPFALNTTDVLFASSPKLKQVSPAYRNRQYVLGGTTLVTSTTSIVGNGFQTAWDMALPVDSITSIFIHGTTTPYTFGILGTDTGKDFYYTKASTTVSQDPSATPLDPGLVVDVNYYGQQPVVAISNNASQQTALAAVATGTSGIVEMVETATGATQAAAQVIADARITQYAILSSDWAFSTQHAGLLPGHLLSVFVPEYNLMDVEMLVTSVTISISAALDATGNADLFISYAITCTDGAYLGQWTDVFVRN